MSRKTIKLNIECPSCGGTGLYIGMGEGKGVAVICRSCKGSGEFDYAYSYKEFKGRKVRDDIKRVYLSGTRYKIGLGKVDYKGVGVIDMDKEGVSYPEFLNGATPGHIKQLGCPMTVDQGACHEVRGFVDKCNELNGGWISIITECRCQSIKLDCWARFEKGDK